MAPTSAAAPAPTAFAATTPTAFAATGRVAARSRAHGPTAALWHAVDVHRPAAEIDGACELTLCGTLARIVLDEPWPSSARDVCRSCTTLTGAR